MNRRHKNRPNFNIKQRQKDERADSSFLYLRRHNKENIWSPNAGFETLRFPENGRLGDQGGDDVRVHVWCRPSVFKIACPCPKERRNRRMSESQWRRRCFEQWTVNKHRALGKRRFYPENRSPLPSFSVSRPTRTDAPRFATPWASSKANKISN